MYSDMHMTLFECGIYRTMPIIKFVSLDLNMRPHMLLTLHEIIIDKNFKLYLYVCQHLCFCNIPENNQIFCTIAARASFILY